jgi:hypothetical protein
LFRNQAVGLRIEKNEGRLFRRPKLTLSCSAEGKEGRKPQVYAVALGSKGGARLYFTADPKIKF